MDGDIEINQKEFCELSPEEVTKIIKLKGKPKVGVYLPDGSRRAAIIIQDAIPETNDFYNKILGVHLDKFKKDIEIMFEDGLKTLIIPCLKHSNFERNELSIKIITNSIKAFFTDQKWLDLYDKLDVKVGVYGDFSYLEEMGYGEIKEWASEVENITKNNKSHNLFWGLTASNKYEIPRLINMSIKFFKEYHREPKFKEILKLYYGDEIDEVDFLIRAAEIRDSDMQPLIISGIKTQMYFLVAPTFISFTRENYRKILYDLIFYRSEILGKKNYYFEDLINIDTKTINEYYKLNNASIIGLGKRIGKFWLPNTQIIVPEKLRKEFDK